MSESKRTIVITGVTRGLGRALTDEFIRRGHTVAGCGRTAGSVEALRKAYGKAHSFETVDVACDDSVRDWARKVMAQFGAPDLLINNAALINPTAPLWEIPPDEFSRVVDVNIKGVFSVIRHFAPPMLARRKGIIVNLSSGWGRSADAGVAPYCATKWAIEGLSQALAQEIPSGMAAVALNPGIIDTEMLRSCFGESAGAYAEPKVWARVAASYILDIQPAQNGQPLTVPDPR